MVFYNKILIILFMFLMFCERYKKYLAVFNSKDFLSIGIDSFKTIQKEYKIAFLLNFLLLNAVYLYFNMNFLHGSHDWMHLQYDLDQEHYITIGRFSIPVISALLEWKYLPFLNHCLGFIFLSLTPIFLIKYWKLPVTVFNIFALSSLLLLYPLLPAVLYFLHLSYAYLLAPLLIVIALILSEKKNCLLSFLSVLLLVFAIGDYNVCLNTLAVIFLGKMLLEYSNGNSISALFKTYFRTICIICISCITYFIIIQWLKYTGIFAEKYNTALLASDQILPRIFTVFVDSFKHFYTTYPFLDLKYVILLSLLFVPMLVLMVGGAMQRKSACCLLGSLFIFTAIIFSANSIHCITDTYVLFYTYVTYFSLPYVYTCAIAYILNSRLQWTKNVFVLLLIPICYFSVIRDFECQKFWKIGLDGDKTIITRLVDRIEQQDEFSYKTSYHFISIGYYTAFNSAYYQSQYDQNNAVVNNTFFPPKSLWAFISQMPRIKWFKSAYLIDESSPVDKIQEKFSDIPKDCIMKLKPWPHKNSVAIYENKIIVCWQEEELEYVKKVLAKQPESQNGE